MEREFKVNTKTTYAQKPSVAVLEDGKFVVVWESYGSVPGAIYGQRFSSDGTSSGAEFPVSNPTQGYQANPKVASLGSEFIVVWEDQQQRLIYSKRFNATSEIPSNDVGFVHGYHLQYRCDYTWQSQPSIATIKRSQQDPTLLLLYRSDCLLYGSESYEIDQNIYGTFINNHSVPGLIFDMSSYGPYANVKHTATLLDNNNAIVAWEMYPTNLQTADIYIGKLDSYGLLGEAIMANAHALGSQRSPAIAALTSSSFVVAWESYNSDGSSLGIRAQKFRIDASDSIAKEADEFQVNIREGNTQTDPAIAALSSGDYVIVWRRTQSDGYAEVFAQKFFSNGTRLGWEFPLNIRSYVSHANPAIAAIDNGGGIGNASFIGTWNSLNGSVPAGIYARRLLPRTSDVELATIPVANISSYVDGYLTDVNLAEHLELGSFDTHTTSQTWKEPTATLRPLMAYSAFPNGYTAVLITTLNEQAPQFELQLGLYDQSQPIRNYTTVGRFRNIGNIELATFADNSAVIAWSVPGAYGDNYNIVLKALFPHNNSTEDNVLVISPTHSGKFSLAGFPDHNSFIVAFMKDEHNLVMQKFELHDGRIVGEDAVTRHIVNIDPEFIVKASPSDESILLVWSYPSYHGIFAQKHDASGAVVGPRTNIRTTLNRFVAALNEAGEYAIAWQADYNAQSLAQVFDNVSARIGSEININDAANQTLIRAQLTSTGLEVDFVAEDENIKQIDFVYNQTQGQFIAYAAPSSASAHSSVRYRGAEVATGYLPPSPISQCAFLLCGPIYVSDLPSPQPLSPVPSPSPQPLPPVVPSPPLTSPPPVAIQLVCQRLRAGLTPAHPIPLTSNNFICGDVTTEQKANLTSTLVAFINQLSTEITSGPVYKTGLYALCNNIASQSASVLSGIYASLGRLYETYGLTDRVEYVFTNDSGCSFPYKRFAFSSTNATSAVVNGTLQLRIHQVRISFCPGYHSLLQWPILNSVKSRARSVSRSDYYAMGDNPLSISQYEVVANEVAYAFNFLNATALTLFDQSNFLTGTKTHSPYGTNAENVFFSGIAGQCHSQASACSMNTYPECFGLYMSAVYNRNATAIVTRRNITATTTTDGDSRETVEDTICGLDNATIAATLSSASEALNNAITNLVQNYGICKTLGFELEGCCYIDNAVNHIKNATESGVRYQYIETACTPWWDNVGSCTYNPSPDVWLEYLAEGGCRPDVIDICYSPTIDVFPLCSAGAVIGNRDSLYSTMVRLHARSALMHTNDLSYDARLCKAADSCRDYFNNTIDVPSLPPDATCIDKTVNCMQMVLNNVYCDLDQTRRSRVGYTAVAVEPEYWLMLSGSVSSIFSGATYNLLRTFFPIGMPSANSNSTTRSAFYNTSNTASTILANGYRVLVTYQGASDGSTVLVRLQFYDELDVAGIQHKIGRFPEVHNVAVGGFGSKAVIVGWSIRHQCSYNILLRYMSAKGGAHKILALPSYDGAFALATLDDANTFVVASRPKQHRLVLQKFSFDGNALSNYTYVSRHFGNANIMFDVKAGPNGYFNLFYSYLDEQGIFIQQYDVSQMDSGPMLIVLPVRALNSTFNPIIKEFKVDFSSTGSGIVAWTQQMGEQYIHLNYVQLITTTRFIINDTAADTFLTYNLYAPSLLASGEYMALAKIDFMEGIGYVTWLQLEMLRNCTLPVYHVRYDMNNNVCNMRIYQGVTTDQQGTSGQLHISIINNETLVPLWDTMINNTQNVLALTPKEQKTLEFITDMNISDIANQVYAYTPKCQSQEIAMLSDAAILHLQVTNFLLSGSAEALSRELTLCLLTDIIPTLTGGARGAGAVVGTIGAPALAGAALGSVVPVIGTGLGAIAGGLFGGAICLVSFCWESSPPEPVLTFPLPPLLPLPPSSLTCSSLVLPSHFTGVHSICMGHVAALSFNVETLVEIITGLDSYIATVNKVDPNPALPLSSTLFCNDPFDSTRLLRAKPLPSALRQLQQNLREYTFNYRQSTKCKANTYSSASSQLPTPSSIIEIYLCDGFFNDAIRFPLPEGGKISQYQILVREFANTFNIYNGRDYNVAYNNKKLEFVDCQKMGSECSPFNIAAKGSPPTIPPDCFGFYMEGIALFYRQTNTISITISPPSLPISTVHLNIFGFNDPRKSSLQLAFQQVYDMLLDLNGITTSTFESNYWDTYSQYVCNRDYITLQTSWPLVRSYIGQMLDSINKLEGSNPGISGLYLSAFCPYGMGAYTGGCASGNCKFALVMCRATVEHDGPNKGLSPKDNTEYNRVNLFSTIAHELTHALYLAEDLPVDPTTQTYNANDCEDWAKINCGSVIPAGLTLKPYKAATCMEIFFNAYFIENY